MDVVIYARYSSHNQQETSIEGQLRVCYDYCERNGYNVIHEYIDRAFSGTTDNRPDFLQMIEDSSKKTFQAVVVYQLDRFSRNRNDSAAYKTILKKRGVRVLSARENISEDASGIILEGLLETMAEYYSVELSQKVKRGMNINAEKCLSTGGNRTLGFKVDENKRFQIDPDTAPIIRFIFEKYADGVSIQKITELLNEQGYKTVKGLPFGKNSIRNILCNKRYIGVYTYNGTETPDGMPRIISDELFEKVQEILAKNKKAPARARAKVEYLLTTKLFCGHCKEMMTGISGTGHLGKVYRYYECKGVKKHECKKKKVNKEYIEDLVVAQCRKLLTTKNINIIARDVSALCEKERDTYNLKRLKKQLSEIDRKHNNLIDAIAECEYDSVRKSLYEKSVLLEKQRESVLKEIKKEEQTQPMLTETEIRFFLTSLKNGNADDIVYKKALINTFVNTIYLYDDRLTIILNVDDEPVVITDELLSDLGINSSDEKGLFKGSYALPKSGVHQTVCSFYFMQKSHFNTS